MPDMSQPTADSTPSRGGKAIITSPPPQTVSGSQSQNQSQPLPDSGNQSSQATTNSTSNDTDRVFTPPESDSEASHPLPNGSSSHQNSQLMQLSNLAALQQKLDVSRDDADAHSRKRMADGAVKHTRHHSSASPVKMGHSRNTSTVSMASNSSRIGELSAELKAKLSYALVKVNNGWQSHSIDEIESLASHAASPASSTSTLHRRHNSSASPRVPLAGYRQTMSTPSSAATSPVTQYPQTRTYECGRRESTSRGPMSAPLVSQAPTLGPPASIQPRQPLPTNPRRSSHARYPPAYLSHQSSPHTPLQPSPLQSTPGPGQQAFHSPNVRSPHNDPILFSPPPNVREQEALETLLFLSSPDNSANLKHGFPTSQQRTTRPRNGTRTSLPTSRLGQASGPESQGRTALPTIRPPPQPPKRVEFEQSPSTINGMDVDEQYGPSQTRAMPRRKTISGSVPRASMSTPAGLGGLGRTKPPLSDEDIQRMIDRVAEAGDSSDSEGEIQLPPKIRRNGSGVGV
ncbi:hypothetical protein F4808DRAFT_440356 [Astrocystis sublimbata]|nr:hypothetical protein F4808DRAFT_440356 [Astrocystis sublimbata]